MMYIPLFNLKKNIRDAIYTKNKRLFVDNLKTLIVHYQIREG
jgi:hypothetical protein